MYFCDRTSVLSDIISDHHCLIPVINRFGIHLGVGDKTIQHLCKEHSINVDFFLTILNTFINEAYFPENILRKFDVESVVNYVQQTDSYLLNTLLLNLEKHLNAFIAMSDSNNHQLKLIRQMTLNLKSELFNQLEQGEIQQEFPLALLYDLKNLLIKHISGNFNENLCYAVIFTAENFLSELQKQNRIKEKILQPMINDLVMSGIDDWHTLLSDKSLQENSDSTLSQREIDVLRLIATGLLNKEIAEKLNISLNTVLSHRKNITSKLKIKTVSGLIFYCISNGYISTEEIQM